jgi:phage terminase small subunit
MGDVKMPLTPKQECFVEEYLIDLNATQAAIRAGYSKKTARSQGQRMLTNVDIVAAVAGAQGDRAERTNITQDYVLESIVSAMERCKQDDTFNAAGVFKGAELLGKHLGLFQGDTKGVTVNLPFDGWRIERAIVYPDTTP